MESNKGFEVEKIAAPRLGKSGYKSRNKGFEVEKIVDRGSGKTVIRDGTGREINLGFLGSRNVGPRGFTVLEDIEDDGSDSDRDRGGQGKFSLVLRMDGDDGASSDFEDWKIRKGKDEGSPLV